MHVACFAFLLALNARYYYCVLPAACNKRENGVVVALTIRWLIPLPGMDGQVQLMNQQVFAWWSPLTLFGFDSRSTSLGCWLVLVTLLVSASAVRPAQLQWHGRNLVTAVRNQVSKAPGQSQSFF